MDFQALAGLTSMGRKDVINDITRTSVAANAEANKQVSFDSLFQSALGMLEETNALSNMAEEEEINFAMGYTDNLHDLLVAQQKANISLQYVVAVRNSVIDAYKEIMNLQF